MRFICLGLAACLILSSCSKTEPIPPKPTVIVVGDTGSMEPVFHGGEIRPVAPTPYENLKPGDVVLSYFSGKWHIHRLVSKSLGRWTTKGDAAPIEDPYKMTEENYGGVVIP